MVTFDPNTNPATMVSFYQVRFVIIVINPIANKNYSNIVIGLIFM